MKKGFPIHPILFAVFPVLSLYSANVTEVSPHDILWPMLAALAAAILLVLLSWLFLRDLGKACMLASLVLFLSFAYGHIVLPDSDVSFVLTHQAKVVLAAWAAILVVALYLLSKTRWDLRKPTILLNTVAAVMVVIPTVTVTANELRAAGHPNMAPITEVSLSMPETPRDIYYIILDRYASAGALEQQHGFDNGEFLDYLSGKGFFVPPDAHANYAFTAYSLASSLNMMHLDAFGHEVGESFTGMDPLYGLIENHRVSQLLKSSGYQYIHFGSWWEPTRRNANAEVNVNRGPNLSEFSMNLLRTTVVDPVGCSLGLWGDPRKTQWERVRYEFDRVAEVPKTDGPTFVFAHFTVPHPPFVFKSDCSYLTRQLAAERTEDEQYVDQLVAANRMLETLIDRLLADSETPPIIILQSDEGDVPWRVDWNDIDWTEVTDAELRLELGILSALYLPGIDAGSLKSNTSPVNTFRHVFNSYFDAGLELLPDRSYICRPDQPYAFYDVTDRLQ